MVTAYIERRMPSLRSADTRPTGGLKKTSASWLPPTGSCEGRDFHPGRFSRSLKRLPHTRKCWTSRRRTTNRRTADFRAIDAASRVARPVRLLTAAPAKTWSQMRLVSSQMKLSVIVSAFHIATRQA